MVIIDYSNSVEPKMHVIFLVFLVILSSGWIGCGRYSIPIQYKYTYIIVTFINEYKRRKHTMYKKFN